MDKQKIISAVIAILQGKVRTLESAMAQSVDAATNEQTVPEHKYDTLALEASYLAHGQGVRLQQIQQEIAQLTKFMAHSKKTFEKVTLTTVIEVADDNENRQQFMILPCAGGIKLAEFSITTVTPESPIGSQLMGKRVDDEVEVVVDHQRICYAIISLC